MTRWIKPILSVALLATIGLVFLSNMTPPAAAQSADVGPDPQSIWTEMKDGKYEGWAPWPGKTVDFYEGKKPHGKKVKLYMNRTAFGNLEDMPAGSIVVLENYDENEKLESVSVRKRVEGFDAENKDWFWAKYEPDGSVQKKQAGAVKMCIMCHSKADGDDYFLAND